MFVSLASNSFYMPADGVFAAYKRDFGTSRCASRSKDYNSFRRTQKGARCPLLADSVAKVLLRQGTQILRAVGAVSLGILG
jgi:hypothetical protein